MQSASDFPDMDFYGQPLGVMDSLQDYNHNDQFTEYDLGQSSSIRFTPSISFPIPGLDCPEIQYSTHSSEHASEMDFISGGELNYYNQEAVDQTSPLFSINAVSLVNPIPGPVESDSYELVREPFMQTSQLSTSSLQSTDSEVNYPRSPFNSSAGSRPCILPSLQSIDLTEKNTMDIDNDDSDIPDLTDSQSDNMSISCGSDNELEDLCAGTLRPLMKVNQRRQPRRRLNRRHRTTIPKKLKSIILHLYERYNTETGASIVNIAYTITEQYLKPEIHFLGDYLVIKGFLYNQRDGRTRKYKK